MSQMTDSFKQVQKALEKLPGILHNKVMIGATRAATKVIADEAKALVPEDTGLLKKSISVAKAKKIDTKTGHIKFYVVPKSKIYMTKKVTIPTGTGKLKIKAYSYYAHMIEFGTVYTPAQPYLTPAFESSAETSVKAFQEYALKRVDKEVEKLNK